MTPQPSHEELKDLLPAVALETIDGAEVELVIAHVSDCPECSAALEEYRAVASDLALNLPPGHLAAARATAVRARLLARAAAGRNAQPRDRRSSRIVPWSGWLVAAGLASVLLVHHSVHRTIDYGWLAAGLLTFVLIGVVAYAVAQQRRATALRDRLASVERRGTGE